MFRSLFRSAPGIGLLMLILYLLTVPAADRGPKLKRHASRALQMVGDLSDWASRYLERDGGTPLGPATWDTSSGASSRAQPNALPPDFLAALSDEVKWHNRPASDLLWDQLQAEQHPRRRARAAAALACQLPPQWWPVAGQIIPQDELSAALELGAAAP